MNALQMLVSYEPHHCKGCGREMLDRPSFKEREYCIGCGFKVALGISPAMQEKPKQPTLRIVRDAPVKTVMDARTAILMGKTKAKPVKRASPASTPIEIEGEEHLAKEALEELKKIERLTPEEECCACPDYDAHQRGAVCPNCDIFEQLKPVKKKKVK